jgi:hypothetical protein
MATLSALRTRLASKISDGELLYPSSAQIDQAINAAIDFYENKYFWFQESLAVLATVANTSTISSIPSNFKFQAHPNSLVLLNNNYRYELLHISADQFDAITNDVDNGLPRYYTYRNGAFEVTPRPDAVYTVNLYYYKSYANLVNDADTNDFTTYAERLVEYKALLDLIEDYKPEDVRQMTYTMKVKEEYDTIKNETYNRTATGKIVPESIVDYNDYYYRINY